MSRAQIGRTSPPPRTLLGPVHALLGTSPGKAVNPLKRHRDSSRLETFSDAIFAFSATLLVVSLEVPQNFEQLLDELRGFGAFAISFAALILIWIVHNAYFRRFGLSDARTTILNSLLMFVVLFFVYPLKFVAQGMAAMFAGNDNQSLGIDSLENLGILFTL